MNIAENIKLSNREQKRSIMLNAARELFVQRGFTHTSMDLIAKTAEVSKQTLYSHFGDKKGIFQAAIQEYCMASRVVDHDAIDIDQPVDVLLLSVAINLHALLLDSSALSVTRTCIASANDQPEVSELFYKAGPLHIDEAMRHLLQQLHDKKMLTIDNIQFASCQFLSLIKGDSHFCALLGVDAQETQEKNEQRLYLESCVIFFIKAYAP